MDTISKRLSLLYTAIDAVQENDVSKFSASVIDTGSPGVVALEFSGGLSAVDIELKVQSVIYNIAALFGHLRKWAAHQGRDPDDVDRTRDNSEALKWVIDLHDADKHGEGRRGRSGRVVRLTNLRRVLRLATSGRRGAAVGAVLTSRGLQVRGEGDAAVVITGDVLADDVIVSSLDRLCNQALDDWERLLRNWGVSLRKRCAAHTLTAAPGILA